MTPAAPLIILVILWYFLALKGQASKIIWILLNLLDTLRALRQTRPNGRRIGVVTRRKAMRETLTGWIVFVTVSQLEPLVDNVIGWLPLYSTMRMITSAAFFASRTSSSLTLFKTFIAPLLAQYADSIDLTILLIESVALLVWHFTLELPLETLKIYLKQVPYIPGILSFSPDVVDILDPLRTEDQLVTDDSPSATPSAVDPSAPQPATTSPVSETEGPPLQQRQSTTTIPCVHDNPTTTPATSLPTPQAYPSLPTDSINIINDPEPRPLHNQRTLRSSRSTISLTSTKSDRPSSRITTSSIRLKSVNIPSAPAVPSITHKPEKPTLKPLIGTEVKSAPSRLGTLPTLPTIRQSSTGPFPQRDRQATAYRLSGSRPVTGQVELSRSISTTNTSIKTVPTMEALFKGHNQEKSHAIKRAMTRSTTDGYLTRPIGGKKGGERLASKVGEKRLHVLREIDGPESKKPKLGSVPSSH
ncbi:hypothetical protein TREMEDRAFT_59584 [Tremella mesenterica DSM 1558]|uniref:uncharacterized protein n=1 Tax=Tremella mesenterica (strain ATCC 24925 / CBS 8224 / DSM 1558 / NBRC 9311 / NRRL Y-6157 / RJB 2259-6 / UBC 559-6) TaxID=578456 RepID=UPI0003F49405|nr:uncharacterized protein TREMEDRAFT_59584 [Tremella mesenterica DSM 1558]EIW73420.1 hypothetical protein TREMEDRAFT_59584 [Tremella mesenterica DSM 1558]